MSGGSRCGRKRDRHRRGSQRRGYRRRGELFFIFKTVFPAHLERLSGAIDRNETAQVESESHALKGMLLNLSAPRAAAAASVLEQMGRDRQSDGMKQAFSELQAEVEALLAQINRYPIDSQT